MITCPSTSAPMPSFAVRGASEGRQGRGVNDLAEASRQDVSNGQRFVSGAQGRWSFSDRISSLHRLWATRCFVLGDQAQHIEGAALVWGARCNLLRTWSVVCRIIRPIRARGGMGFYRLGTSPPESRECPPDRQGSGEGQAPPSPV